MRPQMLATIGSGRPSSQKQHVPFDPYADFVAERAARLQPARILETAAGTGVVTRAMREAVPQADIIASDMNPGVLEVTAQQLHARHVTLEHANAPSTWWFCPTDVLGPAPSRLQGGARDAPRTVHGAVDLPASAGEMLGGRAVEGK